MLFLRGILRVWGLSPRRHQGGSEQKLFIGGMCWEHQGLYWQCCGPCWECTGGALKSVLGVPWQPWGLYWECAGAALRASRPIL